ncbi:unnamed protein product [Lactuca saligna]|uniref:TFIIS N-terminal domain-containing protein n=1 Tax=Lactuca saligna TaxID=75948 RepID=A0AA35ZYS9_LACSI|nr:unnamed protein product [Lactuca saligna]
MGKKKKKIEKSAAEIALLVENVMVELEVVAEEDAELNRQSKPAINKLKKLPLLTEFPIHLDQYDRKEQLKKSGLGKAIMFLSKSDEETTSNRKLAKDLVDKGVSAVVYLAVECTKSFKFLGAFPVLLEMGVLSVFSLESMSSLDMEGLCALGDGHLLNFLLNTSTGELTDRKKVALRKELRMLSQAARDVGPIREAKDKLEK